MTENILDIKGLSKRYGRITALNQLNLSVPKGSIFGLLGPNGSGKTTTLGMILGVLRPSAGNFRWMGKPLNYQTKREIGAILETPNFYPYLSGYRNLQIVAEIKKVPYERIDQVLKQVHLDQRAHSNFKTYSLGMKQRLAIASALLSNPKVLILDEPTNGLDPQGIAEIRQLITDIAQDGITIILASHLLDEVERVCTHAAVLRQGQKLFSGPVTELTGQEGLIEIAADDMDALYDQLRQHPAVKTLQQEGTLLHVVLKEPVAPAELNKYLGEKGIFINHLVFRKTSLEQQFLNLISAS